MITACTCCGRDNEAGSRFCMDCGKPLAPSVVNLESRRPARDAAVSGARAPDAATSGALALVQGPVAGVVTCPRCAHAVEGRLPFCGACGTRLAVPAARTLRGCANCGNHYAPGDVFCARCGGRVGSRVSIETTLPGEATPTGLRLHSAGPRLALLDDAGGITTVFTLERGEAVIGRAEADIRFADDSYMSPLHARLEMRNGALWIRDLGSRNRSWVYIAGSARLSDGDTVLIGSQVVRFRRLGFPGPFAPDAEATRRMGSLTPSADIAVLEQLRPDGSVRDMIHLSPGRSIVAGRESGDWLFPYDKTMSGRHAEVRSKDTDFFIHDIGSRNGVAVAVRGERMLGEGERILVGDQILRVESL